jgi:hypothetical protein
MLLGMGACNALVRIERLGATPRRLVALAASVLGMMLAHYYAIAPAAAIGFYVVLRLRGIERRDAVVALALAAVMFALVWGWGIWQQRGNIALNNWWVVEDSPWHLRNTWLRAALLPMRFLNEPLLRSEPAAAAGAILFVLPLILARRRPELSLWWLWMGCVTALPLMADLAEDMRQLDYLRYTIIAAPAAYALIALIGARARPWMRHALPAAALASCLIALPQAYAQTQTQKPDWRLQAKFIDDRAKPSDVVVFFGPSRNDRGLSGHHYVFLRRYAANLPKRVVFATGAPDEALLARLREAGVVWTIVPYEMPVTPDRLPGFVMTDRHDVFALPSVRRWEVAR